ncbi:radical SAM protein [Corynebacterium sphenisci DSM 44792]|uniref:Lipoyl synthase n=1 Tax=Corynebacterium sphenisci DSM 44792 TaxID=1437874 RepID=A0A1L7CYU9_9CORY|nr:lipoyl synthase [Corynebacterium sphenisci]APT91002.1 radical SAM protein [Corynebacterium sphenisci DSM 44792]
MAQAPKGRRLLRIEAKNAQTPIEAKPGWIRTTAKTGPEYREMKSRVSGASLHTVCQEANCPNMYECWESREATFLIGGGRCTRRCDFCNIATGKPEALDRDEPRRVAESVREMGLRYATVTGVARDDLPDGASWLYAETCRQIHELNPGTGVELLVDDFRGDGSAAEAVFEARPEVFAHNLETVPRIFKKIRPAFRYERSLEMIHRAREYGLVTKSNLILGMGETREEILDTMHDLLESGCDILTVTQYLRPTNLHHPIDRWVKPEEFVELSNIAREMGFAGVMAGPLVRSSYRAGTLYARALAARGEELPEHLAGLAEGSDSTAQEASSVLARFGASTDVPVAPSKAS